MPPRDNTKNTCKKLLKNKRVRSSLVTMIVVLALVIASAIGVIEISDELVDNVVTKSTSIVESAVEISDSVSKNTITDDNKEGSDNIQEDTTPSNEENN